MSSNHSDGTLSLGIRKFSAGALSGVFTKSSIAPLERLKILFQIQGIKIEGKLTSTSQYEYGTSVRSAVLKVYQQDGLRGFYRGNMANCVRVIPVYALKFTINDGTKELLCSPGQTTRQLPYSKLLAAGMIAGGTQITITYPLELIRTRLAFGPSFGVQYNGISHCVQEVVRTEGARALFKGLVPTYCSGIPYVGFQMSFYEVFSRWLAPDPDELSGTNIIRKLGAGALAGVSAQTITYPGDVVRRRMQGNGMNGKEKVYDSIFDCWKKTIARERVVGLYRGLHVAWIRCLPGAAIQFASYDLFKTCLDKWFGS